MILNFGIEAMIPIFILIILVLLMLLRVKKIWKLSGDQILNPTADPFLAFAEHQRRWGKKMFAPWVTTDSALLSLAQQYFPTIPLPDLKKLKKPDITPVKITLIGKRESFRILDEKEYFIAVGGPSAAMVAFQQAKNGRPVLYINNSQYSSDQISRPIWTGAANHGETDVFTQAPAYVNCRHVFTLMRQEWRHFINPPRYDTEVLHADYPWLTLNLNSAVESTTDGYCTDSSGLFADFLSHRMGNTPSIKNQQKGLKNQHISHPRDDSTDEFRLNSEDWLRHPLQIAAGLRVALRNYQLAKQYTKNEGNLFQELRVRMIASHEYLMSFNNQHGKIVRDSYGSLIIVPDEVTWSVLQNNKERLRTEHRELIALSAEEALQRYGIMPRHAFGIMEKKDDFIFEPHFMDTIIKGIKTYGGEVINHWHLSRILVNKEKKQANLLEFREKIGTSKSTFHYKKCRNVHLSLGSTLFDPNPYDLVSVTGASINALVFGVYLNRPIVCGSQRNHIAVVPLAEPINVQNQTVSFIRIAVGGAVGPLNRTKSRWYTYPGQNAVNALHCLRQTLPEKAEVKVLSVIGCNRLIGLDGRQVELNPFIRISGKKK